MSFAATLDDIRRDVPKPVWIVGTILAFVWCWPVGLAIVAFLWWSGRMGRHWHGCWGHRGHWHTHWHNGNGNSNSDTARPATPRGPSGNRAFDEYRAETLRRLEDEQQEFIQFLERLRMAKDKAEFDQFMAERRQPRAPEPPPAPAA
jgi:hypothetical protein